MALRSAVMCRPKGFNSIIRTLGEIRETIVFVTMRHLTERVAWCTSFQ